MTPESPPRTRESRVFAERAARTIVDLQRNVNSVSDIAVLLEVSGITEDDLEKHGFRGMYELASYVRGFFWFFEGRAGDPSGAKSPAIPSKSRRLAEGLAFSFPTVGPLAVLFITGVSLWMASNLPADFLTALMFGFFLGMFIAGGPEAAFQRLFVMNHSQMNLCEAERMAKRDFLLTTLFVVGAAAALLLFGYLDRIPVVLILVSIVGLGTISLHRASFLMVNALKKLRYLIGSYAVAILLVPLVFFATTSLLPDGGARYLAALDAAFAWLCCCSVYARVRMFRVGGKDAETAPIFYRSQETNRNTIRPRLSVQLWEAMPAYVFGTFFLVMMFGDRLISWFFNPEVRTGVTRLPILFNTQYHLGADTALVVFFVTALVQYVIMAGIYEELTSVISTQPVLPTTGVERFLRKRYLRLMAATAVSACCAATVTIYLVAPFLAARIVGFGSSKNILEVACLANILLAVFTGNSMFILFTNRTKFLAAVAVICTAVLAVGGLSLATLGFQDIVYAYFASAALAAVLTTFYITRSMKSISSSFFARFA